MALLSLTLAGAFSLLVGSFAVMRRTQESLYVNRLLETALEMTRNLSFEDIAGGPGGTPAGYAATSPVSFSTRSSLVAGDNGQVLYNKGMPEVSDPQAQMLLTSSSGLIYFRQVSPDLYSVTATVTYTPHRLGATTKQITTYIGRKGVNRR